MRGHVTAEVTDEQTDTCLQANTYTPARAYQYVLFFCDVYRDRRLSKHGYFDNRETIETLT